MLIGVGVVGYLFYQQFDPEEFYRIDWTATTLLWLGVSLLLLVVRHLAYAYRLYLLTEHEFSYLKCIQLIFIWEFSSAVSPTAVGGSAVAFFVLSQERLSAGRTATLVLYTVVLDSAFFVLTLPVLYLLMGPELIRPGAEGFSDLRGWGLTFVIGYVAMASYGLLIFWGLFVSPNTIKRFFFSLAGWPFIKRWGDKLRTTGRDLVAASKHVRGKPLRWHLGAFGSTAVAWTFRFLLLSALFVAFTDLGADVARQLLLYGRLESMFVIIAFSPTPGGAGFVETLFGNFLSDFVDGSGTRALLIATIWRAFTYYTYLLAGAIIVPAWFRGVIAARRQRARDQVKDAPGGDSNDSERGDSPPTLHRGEVMA